jgi:hypothetical protein
MNEGKGGKGEGHGDKGVGQGIVTLTERAMAAATRVVGNEESTGNRDAIARALATEMQLQQQQE